MRVSGTTLVVCVLLGSVATEAEAARSRQEHAGKAAHGAHAHKSGHRQAHPAFASRGRHHALPRRVRAVQVAHWGGISCVPYARNVTGMAITGNGGDWWHNASGSYDRGSRPEPGSVMAFRATGGMSYGHVAVVSRVLGPRHVLIDHANWGGPGIRKGTIMHDVNVIDVSANNDWSAVRVQVGYDAGSYGRVYPTYGFIYNRPEGDTGTAYAAAASRQRSMRFEELAEMPVGAPFGAQPVSFQTQGLAPLHKAAAQGTR